MKRIIFLLVLTVGAFTMPVFAQEYVELIFSDTFNETSGTRFNVPALSKEKRTSSRAPSFEITNESDLEEKVYKGADYAMSVWESCIIGDNKIYIKVQLADNIEEDIRTSVHYIQRDGLLMPYALFAYLENISDRDNTTPDGIITINSNTIWDYNLGDNISPDKKNLSFGIMRAIARILGFGSSVQVESLGSYKFTDKRYHTIFDNIVSDSSNKKLTSISVNRGKPSQELKDFIENPNMTFWVNTGNKTYQLAEPPYTKECPPFVFLKDKNSLMRSDLNAGDYILNVDQTTGTILRSLGWNTQSPLISIFSDDVDETGLASAYSSHRFRINTDNLPNNTTISNREWKLELPLANGEIQLIDLADNNLSCTTAPIENEKNYKINSDGDIEAQLKFRCTIDEAEIRASFKIYFELKPLIEYAVIDRIEDNAPYESYNAYYTVKYRGADRIQVYLEQEYTSKVDFKYIKEPYIASGVADHIANPSYAWIDFVAENEYGKSVYTIELQPYGIVSGNSGLRDDLVTGLHSVKADEATDGLYEVYDISGIYIGQFTKLSDIRNISPKGILIVRRTDKNSVETFKFINR